MPHLVALLGALPLTANEEMRRPGRSRNLRRNGIGHGGGGGGAAVDESARGQKRAVTKSGDVSPLAAPRIGKDGIRNNRRGLRVGVREGPEIASTTKVTEPTISSMAEAVEESVPGVEHLDKPPVSEVSSAVGTAAGAQSTDDSSFRSVPSPTGPLPPMEGAEPPKIVTARTDLVEPGLAAAVAREEKQVRQREQKEQEEEQEQQEQKKHNEREQEQHEHEEEEEEQQQEEDETTSKTAEAEAVKHVEAWVSVLDVSAARLGPGLTAEVILPTVLPVLER